MDEPIPSFNDIIEDESFIRWVKHNSWQDANYWESKIIRNPEIEENVLAAKKLIQHFDATDTPFDATYQDKLWSKINLATTAEKEKIRPIRSIYFMAAAAAAAVLIFMVFGLLPQTETYQSKNGEIISVILPDQSEATLNAGSTLIYTGNRFNTQRKVNLDGETFFRVVKGRTFRVLTDQGTITVLGTTFNVKSRDKKLSVFCYSGKVKVSDPFKAVYLTAGKKTSKLSGESLQDAQQNTLNEGITWQKGIFSFENALLKEVLSELSRQYNMPIQCPVSEEKRVITTSFDNKNIESALLNVLWPLNLKAEKKDGTYIVQKSDVE